MKEPMGHRNRSRRHDHDQHRGGVGGLGNGPRSPERGCVPAGIGSVGGMAAAVSAADAAKPALYRSELVKRSFEARPFNAILNDPAVYPFVAQRGTGVIDVTPLVDDPNNILLMADGGGMIFLCQEPGIYEVHTAFLKPNREKLSQDGPHIRNVCLAAYRWMFTHTDALTLLMRMPANNRALIVFSPLVGWVKEFERKAVWPTVDEEMVDVTFAAIRYDDWLRKTPDVANSGRWFHQRCEEELRRHGREELQHDDDDHHDLWAGACVEMIFGGQVEKAVILYNRWARLAGYGLISLIARAPLVLEIDGALIQCADETFRIVKLPGSRAQDYGVV
jgi:hypothetical protein